MSGNSHMETRLVEMVVMHLKKLQTIKIFIMVSLKILFSTFNRVPLQYISDLVFLAWCMNLSGFVMQKYISKQVLRIRKRKYIFTEMSTKTGRSHYLHEKAFPSKPMKSYSTEYFYEASTWGLLYHFHVVLFWHDHH